MTPHFALFIFMAPISLNGAPLQTPAMLQPAADLSEAEALYNEGQTRYESADYNGAIAKFTEALDEAKRAGSKEFHVRGLLLYNIGRAHIKAYEIDQDLGHLRQARSIYRQFIKEADVEAMFAEFNPQDVADARQELRALEIRLEGLENVTKTKTESDEPSPAPPPIEAPVDWKKPRNTGMGLTAAGSAVLVGGVAVLAFGSTLKPGAEGEVNKLADAGVPQDHPAWTEGDNYIESESKRGRTLMALGGALTGVGLIGAGVGIAYLVKAKKLREGRVSPTVALTPTFSGIVVSGRF
jgi:tetratricopeptide (TPR) repeat protein